MKYTKSDAIRQYMPECCFFFHFIILDICLALTRQIKQHRHSSGHNLGKDKLKSQSNTDL